VVCDSAESLGAKYHPQITQITQMVHAGKGAKAAVYSFNGNKIITTSGGGMLASDDKGLIEQARKLSQQAREDFPHYEHTEIGYNYRMSNILAAIGRGQLRVLDERVKKRREIFDYYKEALGDLPGIEFMPEPEWSRSNRWLTVILITPEEFGADREEVRLALAKENIEARPVWKPMHLQPVFRVVAQSRKLKAQSKAQNTYEVKVVGGTSRGQKSDVRGQGGKQRFQARMVGGKVSEDLFERGLCLPSGTAMTEGDLERVVETILNCRKK
jgi:dTDP-4-amino-4,6-dideoxygalactose transaminase